MPVIHETPRRRLSVGSAHYTEVIVPVNGRNVKGKSQKDEPIRSNFVDIPTPAW
jgi:hypothetical protein